MQTILSEVRESYDDHIVVELYSDGRGGENEVEDNVMRIEEWAKQWREERH